MLIGFNNDVEYRGMTFHIQTEDHGLGGSTIETQLFHSGAILDTVMSSYAEAIAGMSEDEAEEHIRAQMKASHRSLFKKLRAGEYDEMVGLERLSLAEESDIEAEAAGFTPSQERVPAEAQKLEEGGAAAIEAFEKKHADPKKPVSHMSLDKLKSQLSALKQPGDTGNLKALSDPEDTQEDDVAVATQIMDASGVGMEFSADFKAPRQGASAQSLQRGIFGEEPAPGALRAADAPDTVRMPKTIDFAATGATAWTGCRPSTDDLSLVDLVEKFLAS